MILTVEGHNQSHVELSVIKGSKCKTYVQPLHPGTVVPIQAMSILSIHKYNSSKKDHYILERELNSYIF